ncbi:hypothetical protein D3C81_2090200 [compost metagenome]
MLAACEEPRSALELMAVLFPKVKSRFDELMAVGETLAHANYLIAEGELVREEEAAVHRYRRSLSGVSAPSPLGRLS